MFTNESSKFNIKSDSLMSQLSNFSHFSSFSLSGGKKQYFGAQFFRDSLLAGHSIKMHSNDLKQEEIELGSLSTGNYKIYAPQNECISAFTPYWTSELHQGIQGTSDNENEHESNLIKQEQFVKIEQAYHSFNGLPNLLNDKASSQLGFDQKATKNETKNIPKNYGKAIIIFIQKNREIMERVLKENDHDYETLLSKLKGLKKKINTISDLRSLWEQQPQSKSIRIISNLFLRKYSLHYIYNSRIKTRLCHAKYKRRLQEAIMNPKDFNHIKDY